MIDKSFQALVLSLIIHGLLVLIFSSGLFQHETPTFANQPIEIEINEAKTDKKRFVTEPEPGDVAKDLREKADYLSRLNRRVKEQMVARNTGITTRNRPGKDPSESEEMRVKGLSGLTLKPKFERPLNPTDEEGPKSGTNMGAGPFGRQVVIGESTNGEYIPGVKQGAFTALNSDRYLYYTFYARLNEQIRNRWVPQIRYFIDHQSSADLEDLSKRDRITEVEIVLNRAGEFVKSTVFRTSGYKDVDLIGINSFRDAAPFPNPPVEMVEEDGFIHLHFGFLVQFEPNRLAVGR